MKDELQKKIKKEVDEIWEKELKNDITAKINLAKDKANKELNNKLDNYDKDISKKIKECKNLLEFEKIKSKMNKQSLNLLKVKKVDPIINAILISLSNIKFLVCYCLKNEIKDIIKKIGEKNGDNFFTKFVEFIKGVWFDKGEAYNPTEIHGDLLGLNKNVYLSNNPGDIITFILSKLNEELNFNNKDVNNKINHYNEKEVKHNFNEEIKANKTIISENFFVYYKYLKTCSGCEATSYFYDQKPIVNLNIEYNISKSLGVNNKLELNSIELNENYFKFLTCENIRYIKEDCPLCLIQKDIKINTYYEDSDNNTILIININRKKDPNDKIDIKYPLQFIVNKNKDIKYELISVIYKNPKLIDNEEDGKNEYNYKINVFCKNFINKKWYLYEEKQHLKYIENEDDIMVGKEALVLIYQKI